MWWKKNFFCCAGLASLSTSRNNSFHVFFIWPFFLSLSFKKKSLSKQSNDSLMLGYVISHSVFVCVFVCQYAIYINVHIDTDKHPHNILRSFYLWICQQFLFFRLETWPTCVSRAQLMRCSSLCGHQSLHQGIMSLPVAGIS